MLSFYITKLNIYKTRKIIILVIVTILFSCCSDKTKYNKNKFEKKSIDLIKDSKPINKFKITFDKSKVSRYTIENIENSSVKAMVKNLSTYTTQELINLPLFKRQIIRIIVPTFITKESLRNTLKYIIFKRTKENKDIDEIIIFAFDNKKDIDDFYTFGRLIWAAKGKLGNITPEIAKYNNRDNYKFEINIKDKVGNIKKSDIPTKRELSIYYMFSDEKYLDYPEEKLTKLVMKKFNIKSKKEFERIYLKVVAYKLF